MSEGVTQQNTKEITSELTLFAEPVAHLGNFTITNSLIMSWITVVMLVLFFVLVGKMAKKSANRQIKKLQNLFEIILEQALNLADSVTGNRKKTERYMPIVLALFLFILLNNWLGLLPGVGTV
jgi:F-type H+-transporting ATPase subunit a